MFQSICSVKLIVSMDVLYGLDIIHDYKNIGISVFVYVQNHFFKIRNVFPMNHQD